MEHHLLILNSTFRFISSVLRVTTLTFSIPTVLSNHTCTLSRLGGERGYTPQAPTFLPTGLSTYISLDALSLSSAKIKKVACRPRPRLDAARRSTKRRSCRRWHLARPQDAHKIKLVRKGRPTGQGNPVLHGGSALSREPNFTMAFVFHVVLDLRTTTLHRNSPLARSPSSSLAAKTSIRREHRWKGAHPLTPTEGRTTNRRRLLSVLHYNHRHLVLEPTREWLSFHLDLVEARQLELAFIHLLRRAYGDSTRTVRGGRSADEIHVSKMPQAGKLSIPSGSEGYLTPIAL